MTATRHCSESDEPIHLWFNLSYSNYLVVQRSLMQSMPIEWQRRFVECLEELDDAAMGLKDLPGAFEVIPQRLDGDKSIEIEDPYRDYQRGRRRVPLNITETPAG